MRDNFKAQNKRSSLYLDIFSSSFCATTERPRVAKYLPTEPFNITLKKTKLK